MEDILFEKAPKYDINRKCPKCNSEAHSRHIKKGETIIDYTYPNECILRTCRNCGYQWVEKTLEEKDLK